MRTSSALLRCHPLYSFENIHSVDYLRWNAILQHMESETQSTSLVLPPALLAEVEAAALEAHRQASDVVREAVEHYLTQSRQSKNTASTDHTPARLTAAEAVERILEERTGNVLPEGVTIRELMTYGRA
jgi:Arc/MetJ-type ribon-helix-helix transcriptional regulator